MALNLHPDLTLYERQWLSNTYKRRAAHQVPRRPFPAQQPHKPVSKPAPILIPYHKQFLGFWEWLGKSRYIWFLAELPPAIRNAWRDAKKHSRVMFPDADGWLR